MNNLLQNSLDLVTAPRRKDIFASILFGLVVIGLSACQPASLHVSKNPFCQQPTNTNDDCSFGLDEENIWLSSSDPSMPIEEGVRLTITSSAPLAQIRGEIRGISMYMGRLPVIWEQGDDGQWHADVMLGACTDPNMVWELRLAIDSAQEADTAATQTLRIPFQSTIPGR